MAFSYWPTNLGTTQAVLDGVVMQYGALPGGFIPGYSSGGALIHEVGHWLMLDHTFQGGCTAANDGISDTPAEASPSYTCDAARDTCQGTDAWDQGLDPVHNYMYVLLLLATSLLCNLMSLHCCGLQPGSLTMRQAGVYWI